MAATKPTYKGKLNRPMTPIPDRIRLAAALIQHGKNARSGSASNHPSVRLLHGAEEAECKEMTERMLLLFAHHDIKRYDYMALAFALAFAHVPGLQFMKDRPGAKTKWTPNERTRLQLEIGALMHDKKCKAPDAARFLVKRSPWKERKIAAATLLREAQKKSDLGYTEQLAEAMRFRRGKKTGEPLTLNDIAQSYAEIGEG